MIGDRWNVTGDEVGRHYPCDDFVRAPTLRPGAGRWAAPFLSIGDLVMARRQLLNFKRLTEQPRTR